MVAACLLLGTAGCSGGDDEPAAVSCSKSRVTLRVVAGPPTEPDAAGDAATTTAAPTGDAASGIEPGSMVEAKGVRFDDRCDEEEAGKPLTALRLAVVHGDVDLNVAGVDADKNGTFTIAFGLPENLPAGVAKVVVRAKGGRVLAERSFEVAPRP